MDTLASNLNLINQVVEALSTQLPAGVEVTGFGGAVDVSIGGQSVAFALDVRPVISAAARARLGLGAALPTRAESILVMRHLPKPLRAKLR